ALHVQVAQPVDRRARGLRGGLEGLARLDRVRDDLLGERPHGLRLGDRREDELLRVPEALDERDRQVAVERDALLVPAIELLSGLPVSHGSSSLLASGQDAVDIHAELETALLELLLDFLERGPAEVAELHEVVRRPAAQVADRLDVLALEAIQ